jgi:hypothetical protein
MDGSNLSDGDEAALEAALRSPARRRVGYRQ